MKWILYTSPYNDYQSVVNAEKITAVTYIITKDNFEIYLFVGDSCEQPLCCEFNTFEEFRAAYNEIISLITGGSDNIININNSLNNQKGEH